MAVVRDDKRGEKKRNAHLLSCDLTAQPPLKIFEFCFEILARRIGTLTYGYPTPPVSLCTQQPCNHAQEGTLIMLKNQATPKQHVCVWTVL